MRRSVAVLVGLVLGSLVGFVPPAGAMGVGVCSISGSIVFAPAVEAADHGGWDLSDAVIECHGAFRAPREFMVRQGPFSGSGSYKVQSIGGHCLRELGTGTADYWIHTDEQDVHLKEPFDFHSGGVGTFTTPTLRGVFEIAQSGACLSDPITKATFLAQVTIVRTATDPA